MKPSIRPLVWSPPTPRRKRLRPLRKHLRRIALPARGEDVVVDAKGRLICGLEDGRVVRLHPLQSSGSLQVLVNTGGRPLGIELDREQRIIVCDAERGLLRLDPETLRLEVLVDAREHGLGFCNNAAVARDGTIYFSDSSQQVGIRHWRGELLAHSGTGRLLRRAPDGEVQVLMEGLQFANGVALSSDESYVAVAETGAYRVRRLWLTGARAGVRDVLLANLPGFPDNMCSDERGQIWIALASPRNRLLDFLLPRAPILRRIVWALPQAVQPNPERVVHVLAVDAEGRIKHDIAGRTRAFHMVTGMRAHGDTLYLASLEEPALAALRLA